MVPLRRAADMALVTLQRSPTPSAASSSASNSEVSPGPAALAGPSSHRTRPWPRVRGGGRWGGEGAAASGTGGLRGRLCTNPPGQQDSRDYAGDCVRSCDPFLVVTAGPCMRV